jgi:hypothetical protein
MLQPDSLVARLWRETALTQTHPGEAEIKNQSIGLNRGEDSASG